MDDRWALRFFLPCYSTMLKYNDASYNFFTKFLLSEPFIKQTITYINTVLPMLKCNILTSLFEEQQFK